MLTPSEIAGKEFEKAWISGYDPRSVDDFIETLTTDYTALYKENITLKQKLKLLVEKVEEYRSTEDAMREALLTARKTGERIIEEATQKSNEIIKQTEELTESKLVELAEKIVAEENNLTQARAETEKYVKASEQLLREHAEFLLKLTDLKKESEKEIAARPQQEKSVPEPERQPQQTTAAPATPATNAKQPAATAAVREGDDGDDLSQTRTRPDYSNLQFGVNFMHE